MVVHGLDGLDEISLSGPTKISRLKDGQVTTGLFEPLQLGMKGCSLDQIKGGSASENAGHLVNVLEGKKGARRDVALINAAAALMVAGRAKDFEEGLGSAAESVDSGRAKQKLERFLEFTRQ